MFVIMGRGGGGGGAGCWQPMVATVVGIPDRGGCLGKNNEDRPVTRLTDSQGPVRAFVVVVVVAGVDLTRRPPPLRS